MFKNITAFQYAVWALDWHMWEVILEYLPRTEARAQADQFETDARDSTHGVTASKLIQNLITTLQARSYEGAHMQYHPWIKQLGEAQRLLPVHVVNQYCRPDRRPDRSFIFLAPTLPRTRLTDDGEWFTAVCNEGRLSNNRLVRALRGPIPRGEGPAYADMRGKYIPQQAREDATALSELLTLCTKQRTELIDLLKNTRALKI
jgi:hypothetical protein